MRVKSFCNECHFFKIIEGCLLQLSFLPNIPFLTKKLMHPLHLKTISSSQSYPLHSLIKSSFLLKLFFATKTHRISSWSSLLSKHILLMAISSSIESLYSPPQDPPPMGSFLIFSSISSPLSNLLQLCHCEFAVKMNNFDATIHLSSFAIIRGIIYRFCFFSSLECVNTKKAFAMQDRLH